MPSFRLILILCLLGRLAAAIDVVTARRLLSREDYDRAVAGGMSDNAIASLYGEPAAQAWESGCEYVARHGASRPPTLDDLFALHRIAYDFSGNSFDSYYRARTASLPPPTRNRALALASRGDLASIARDYGIAPPLGELRDGALKARHRSMGSDGTTFTGEQVERLRANSYLTIERVRSAGDGNWLVEFAYPEPARVHGLLDEAFAEMLRAVRVPGAHRSAEAALIAARFYRRIVSIHPMWDGNGRTARLARDWVLGFLGHPPPRSSPSDDLELTEEELARDLRREMIAARRARSCRYDGLSGTGARR